MVSVVYWIIYVVGSNLTVVHLILFFFQTEQTSTFINIPSLRYHLSCDIKAENTSTLCKFHEGRKGLRSMGSNADPICDPKTAKNSGGYFQKNWVGMCGTLPQTLTLFQTKICDFPYFRPYKKFLKGKWSYRQIMKKKIILLKNIPNSRLECTNNTLF